MVRAAEWLLGEEVTRARRLVRQRARSSQPGGWAFEFANVNYPDVDDTAEVDARAASASRRAPARRGAIDGAIARALRWVEGMQSRTAAGARSTPTTRARSCASCRSWTSAR